MANNRYARWCMTTAALLCSFALMAQSNLNVTYTKEDALDFNTGGSVEFNITGGTAPYTITWCELGATSVTHFEGLVPGVYNSVISDAAGSVAFVQIPIGAQVAWDEAIPQITENRLGDREDGFIEFGLDNSTTSFETGFVYDEEAEEISIVAGFKFTEGNAKLIFETGEIDLPSQYSTIGADWKYKIERLGTSFIYYINGLAVYKANSLLDETKGSPASKLGWKAEGTFSTNVFKDLAVSFTKSLTKFYYNDFARACNVTHNWVYTETYDGNNIPVTAGIAFYDNMGRPMQSQSRNVVANKVLCTESRYDLFGRNVLNTLPAPKLNNDFCYLENFITVDIDDQLNQTMTHREYKLEDFDDFETTLNAPLPISNIQQGELGWYYSNNNTLEDRVPASLYPYSRVEYYNDPLNLIKRTAGAGEAFKMGSNHEVSTFDMPAMGELYYVYGTKYITDVLQYQGVADMPEQQFLEFCHRPLRHEFKVNKKITVDKHGEESITFTDIQGNTIATCLSGSVNEQNVHTQDVFTNIAPGQHFDIHIPKGCETSLDVSQITTGAICDGVRFSIYDINQNFEPVVENATLDYFDEGNVYLLAGYYRIVNIKPSSSGCNLNIRYNLNYYNFALYYYDNVQRLIASVPPEGVDYYDIAMSAETDHNCIAVDALDRIEDGNAYTGYTYVNTFGFDDIPLTPANSSQITYFDLLLDTDCSPGGVSAPPPLGTGSVLAALFADNPIYPQTNFGRNLNDQPRAKQSIGGYTGPLQAGACNNKVGEANIFMFNIVAEYNTGTLDANSQPVYERLPGNSEKTLFYVKNYYTADEHYDEDENQVTKYGFGKFYCDAILGSEYNQDLLLNEYLSCNTEEVRFTVADITKYNSDIYRCSIEGDAGTEIIDQLWNPHIVLENVVPEDEDELIGIKLIYRRNTKIDLSAADHKMVESQAYNSLGQIKWKNKPDEGRTDYLYQKDGNVRFSQNAKQREEFKFSYSNYDEVGRIIEIGEYDAGLAYQGSGTDACSNFTGGLAYGFQPHIAELERPCYPSQYYPILVNNVVENADPLEDARCKDVIRTIYDAADVNLSDLDDNLEDRLQRFVRGRVCKTERYRLGNDADPYNVIWYSYDELGRVEWEVVYTESVGYKTVDYQYDFNGNVTTLTFQKDMAPEKFAHLYTYNKAKQLIRVRTSDENNAVATEARYEYYLHGPLKREEIGGNLQGIDYTYTLQGSLKGINNANLDGTDPGKDGYTGSHSSFQQDLFGMELDYYANDYTRSGVSMGDGMFDNNGDNVLDNTYPQQFNGNIKSVRWKTRNVGVVETDVSGAPAAGYQNMYGFNYDPNLNWMVSAKMGGYVPGGITMNGTVGPYLYQSGKYTEDGLTYSINGNIKTLRRTGESTANMDELAYHYDATLKNRLLYIDDATSATAVTSDLEDQAAGNYAYNTIGQMVNSNSEQDNQAVDYDAFGKIITVWTADRSKKKVAYQYDANGYRVKKTSYTIAIGNAPVQFTYYINNRAGMVMRIVEKSPLVVNNAPPQPQHFETPLYGVSRIGVRYSEYVFDEINSRTGTTSTGYTYNYDDPAMMQTTVVVEYQLADHLGNVRVTFKRGTGNIAEVTSYTDYYPMGMAMPGRQFVGSNAYRYGYQGEYAEKSGETGWNDFELRSYDSRIGRWMVLDPYGQYWSPYLSMGNSWIVRVDPDGGNDDPPNTVLIVNYNPNCIDDNDRRDMIVFNAGLEVVIIDYGTVYQTPRTFFGDIDAAMYNKETSISDKIILDATYGTFNNVWAYFTGLVGTPTTISGRPMYSASEQKQRFDGFVTLVTFGASQELKTASKGLQAVPRATFYTKVEATISKTAKKEMYEASKALNELNHNIARTVAPVFDKINEMKGYLSNVYDKKKEDLKKLFGF